MNPQTSSPPLNIILIRRETPINSDQKCPSEMKKFVEHFSDERSPLLSKIILIQLMSGKFSELYDFHSFVVR